MRWVKRYSFLVMLIVTSLLFGCGKVVSVMDEKGMETPLTDVVNNSKEFVDELQGKTENNQQKEEESTVEDEQQKEEAMVEDEQEKEQQENTEVITPESGEPEKKEFRTVTLDYLSDALFIGDSRTDTLHQYAGWKETDFFVKTGIDIWQIFDRTMDGVYLEEKLAQKQYAKIYIMLGINELGVGTPESFRQQYETVLTKIRQMQPEAIIFLQSIIHVTADKDEEGTDINNEEIDIRNTELKKLTDNESIFWIDANEIFDDPSTGKLSSEYTFDGVHLKAKNIDIWQEFLLQHGI